MSVSAASSVEPECAPENAPAQDGALSDIAALLGVLSTLFIDNVRELEDTVARVTHLVTRDGRPDRELIVTLQSFDRLKQEFEALSGALARYADSTNALPLDSDAARGPFGRDVIHEITLADLKERFLDRLENGIGTVFQPLPEPSEDELETDVIF